MGFIFLAGEGRPASGAGEVAVGVEERGRERRADRGVPGQHQEHLQPHGDLEGAALALRRPAPPRRRTPRLRAPRGPRVIIHPQTA